MGSKRFKLDTNVIEAQHTTTPIVRNKKHKRREKKGKSWSQMWVTMMVAVLVSTSILYQSCCCISCLCLYLTWIFYATIWKDSKIRWRKQPEASWKDFSVMQKSWFFSCFEFIIQREVISTKLYECTSTWIKFGLTVKSSCFLLLLVNTIGHFLSCSCSSIIMISNSNLHMHSLSRKENTIIEFPSTGS